MKFYFQIFIVSFLFAACTSETKPLAAPAINKVKTGEELLIILEETHKDGTTWHLNSDFDHEVIQQNKEVWHGPDKGIYYYLQVIGKGETELQFVKRNYQDTLDHVTYLIANH